MTIKINGTNTTAQPSITGADTDTGLVYGTDEVQVVTGGTTRATVASDGKLSIDRTHASATTGNHPALDIETHANGTAGATFATGIDFRISGVHKKRLAITNVDANVGTGDWVFYRDNGANEGIRIRSGGGISFNGDTAAANALDDYEEGTWTPTVTLGTVSAFNGKYTKIGNIVNLSGELNNFSDRSTSSALRISSLPFNNLNAQAAGSMFGRYMDRTAYTSYVHQNTIWFYSIGSGNFTELQHQHLNNSGATIYFQATYTVS
ncbi:hypothetical protein [uncultured phage_MedDCM-OCT-S45-C4]|uniref:Uncharacterized protein n=1 Tax=uncultured phage_MedDCM-OCT-S45-C4 TaxID=2740801 RepID=A0A6S4PCF5_9CAUD|nr:hypothetical protein HOQ58_gp26 [uncultured phage_MedDCM-OCT-S45-C4]BAQ93967.1 hypothetical protein [uncultured phage_MedDCM-OCT-S45-C4]